jgi:hypothetical protein
MFGSSQFRSGGDSRTEATGAPNEDRCAAQRDQPCGKPVGDQFAAGTVIDEPAAQLVVVVDLITP